MDYIEGKNLIADAWENQLFVATPARCEIILRVVEAMQSYCMRVYAGEKEYISGIYGYSRPRDQWTSPIILTGGAGVGKTTLSKAVVRMFPEVQIDVDHRPSRWSLQTVARMVVKPKVSLLKVLGGFDLIKDTGVNGKASVPDLIEAMQKAAFRKGVAALLLDELQFYSMSEDASTAVAQLYMLMCMVGPVPVCAMNHSLYKRLLARHHEETDRLLKTTITLLPEQRGSTEWVQSLVSRFSISPDVFRIDPFDPKVADDIYHLTQGIERYLSDLLILAFVREGRNGRMAVTMDSVRAAYACEEFSAQRSVLSSILSVRVVGQTGSRKDLLDFHYASGGAKKSDRQSAKIELAEETGKAALTASISCAEAVDLNQLAKRAASGTDRSKLPRVVPIRKKASPTAGELLQSYSLLERGNGDRDS